MVTQERVIHRCGYCRKWYLQEHACLKHEKYCPKNPNNRHACFDCVFLEVDRTGADEGYSEKTFRCTKHEKDLHTFHAERIGHSCLGYTERMPLQCPDHKNHVDQYFEKRAEN